MVASIFRLHFAFPMQYFCVHSQNLRFLAVPNFQFGEHILGVLIWFVLVWFGVDNLNLIDFYFDVVLTCNNILEAFTVRHNAIRNRLEAHFKENGSPIAHPYICILVLCIPCFPANKTQPLNKTYHDCNISPIPKKKP